MGPPKDMVWIPGGAFRMGSDDWYPEERPVHAVTVDGYWMDEHEVTVAEFRRFVKSTGVVTVAERSLDPARYLTPIPLFSCRVRSSSIGPAARDLGNVQLVGERTWCPLGRARRSGQ